MNSLPRRFWFAGAIVLVAGAILAWFAAGRPGRTSELVEDLVEHTPPDGAVDVEVIQAEVPSLTQADIRALLRIAKNGEDAWVDAHRDALQTWLPDAAYNLFDRRRQSQFRRSSRALEALGLLSSHRSELAAELVAAFAEPAAGLIPTAPDFGHHLNAQMAWLLLRFPADAPEKTPQWEASVPPGLRVFALKRVVDATSSPPSCLLPDLIAGLGAKSADDRLFAARALAKYGSTARNAAPALRRLLSDPDRKVRPSAAYALGCVAPEYAEEAVSTMLEEERTNPSWTGEYGPLLYGRLGPAAKAAVPSLADRLHGGARNAGQHGEAAAALWRIQRQATPEIVEALAWDLDHGLQRSRRRAMEALAEIGPPAAKAVPALVRATLSRRLLIRQLATNALASVERPPGG